MPQFFQKPAVLVASLLVLLLVSWQLAGRLDARFATFSVGQSKPGVLGLTSPEAVNVNQPFTMQVIADTQGSDVNATGIYLYFEPQKLRLLSMNTESSFCQFYPEKKFDNNIGTISLACGSPHPGFKGKSTMITLQFMPLVVGSTTIRTDPKSQLLKSDGKGTNILTEYPQNLIHIRASF